MKQLLIAFLGLILAGCTSTGTIQQPGYTSNYDKFEQITFNKTSKMLIKKGSLTDDLIMHMRVWANEEGDNTGNVKAWIIEISTASANWRFLEYNDLVLLAGDERFELNDPSRTGNTRNLGMGVEVTETLLYGADREIIEKLAISQNVEGKVGAYSFEFPFERRESIRIIAKDFRN